jgi:hypothetical protein
MPTGDDLVRRVEERGGEIRLCRSTIQYRPPSVLTIEAKWIRDQAAVDPVRPLGRAPTAHLCVMDPPGS